jgi:putative transposase
MKLTAQIKLLPTNEQLETLKATLSAANAACNYVSEQAWTTKTFRQYDLHHLCYKTIREKFNLSAQLTIRVIAKVADSYKLDRKTRRTFRSTGSIAYDDRILSWNLDKSTISIWTLSGRIRVTFVCGDQQRTLLQTRNGESDLIAEKARFTLPPPVTSRPRPKPKRQKPSVSILASRTSRSTPTV